MTSFTTAAPAVADGTPQNITRVDLLPHHGRRVFIYLYSGCEASECVLKDKGNTGTEWVLCVHAQRCVYIIYVLYVCYVVVNKWACASNFKGKPTPEKKNPDLLFFRRRWRGRVRTQYYKCSEHGSRSIYAEYLIYVIITEAARVRTCLTIILRFASVMRTHYDNYCCNYNILINYAKTIYNINILEGRCS